MDLSNYESLLAPLGVITTFLTTWYTGQKVLREYRKFKKSASDKILEEAKQFSNSVKDKLENRINILETELHNFQSSVVKDFINMKDNHMIELKNLGDKIEALREDLKSQTVGILALLTKLVDKN